MAQPVWVLSVDLQAKTATFQSGMAEAAKSARGAFGEIRSGGDEMGRGVGTNMFEARHAVMLLGDELGGHLPRGVTAFLTSLGPVGAAMEAAFPFLAIAVGATLLIEHFVKMQEAGQKLTQDQLDFGTAVQNAFNSLDQKLIQSGIKADELRNDHIGALAKQLELIDKQSMAELVHSFGEVAKAADVVFADLKTSWYNVDAGSDRAKHSLESFKTQYDSLLAQGRDKQASDLLRGTLESQEKILALQKEAAAHPPTTSMGSSPVYHQDPKLLQTLAELQKVKAGYSENEVKAQEQLVAALTAQLSVEERVAALKKSDSDNAGKASGNEAAARGAAMARAAAESQLRIQQTQLAGDRAMAEARLEITRASISERLASEIGFADREAAIKAQANAAEIAGLDKSGKDYQVQLKGLKEKQLELEAEHAAKVAEIRAKASVQQNAEDLQTLEQSIRAQLENTAAGSAARLAIIDAGIRQEEAKGLQTTNFYRDLSLQRVQTAEKMVEETNKLTAEAGREAADNEQKMGELEIAAMKQADALKDSTHQASLDRQIQEEIKYSNAAYALKQKELQQDIAALNKHGADYDNKLKALQNKEMQLRRAHQNEITALEEKATIQRNQTILSSEQQALSAIAGGLAQSILGHQTWSSMVVSFGRQAAEGMLKNMIMIAMGQEKQKLSDAKAAAASAYAAGESIGGPIGLVMGPVFAAAAFAGVMAFEQGGIVPGYGKGDTVPAMLTPGEGVVPKGVMDGLANMARNGGMQGGGSVTHVHVRPVYHLQALDQAGMEKTLEKHSKILTRHFQKTVRGMNK